jgi:prepilin-type processing-associated H-X9-DG protein
MKQIFKFAFLLTSFALFAQVPQGISYQAIALNASGNQLVNAPVGLKLSIIDNTAAGTVLYAETHTKTTNDKGLYNLVVGQGTVVTGTFNTIDWGKNSKFLKVEMDPNGGTSYTTVGNTQMLSVPYAMYSGKTASIAGNTNINDELQDNRSANIAFADGLSAAIRVYNAKLDKWTSTAGTLAVLNGFFQTQIIGSNQNFAFADGLSAAIRVYNANLDEWTSTSGTLYLEGSGSVARPTAIVGSNGNFAFADGLSAAIRVYNSKLNKWTSTAGTLSSGTNIVNVNGNFAFADGLSAAIRVYNAKLDKWTSTAGTLSSGGNIVAGPNNIFGFADGLSAAIRVYNVNLDEWNFTSGTLSNQTAITPSSSN